jgi:hypothetical protein
MDKIEIADFFSSQTSEYAAEIVINSHNIATLWMPEDNPDNIYVEFYPLKEENGKFFQVNYKTLITALEKAHNRLMKYKK